MLLQQAINGRQTVFIQESFTDRFGLPKIFANHAPDLTNMEDNYDTTINEKFREW